MSQWTEGGAGQTALPYPYYVDIVTKRYFDGVDNKNMDQVLDCFHDDAVLTEVTSSTVHNGKAAIKAMFVRLFTDFDDIWHGNFVLTADPQTNAICSQFTVLITPAGSDTELRYENCNRFYLKGDRFQRVYVYMSGDNLLKEGDL
ncbi:nuclear transport factor 2 family protein [Sphingomonas sp. YL-JM2C]